MVPVASIGSVPTTPDPNTSAKASRYKWEPYHDTTLSAGNSLINLVFGATSLISEAFGGLLTP